MKKFILGLILGVLLTAPITAVASHGKHLGFINDIYQTDENVKVGVFDDQDNKCYVAYTERAGAHFDEQPSISCVKAN